MKEQKEYKLTITKDGVTSTNPQFTMDNLDLGDDYRPVSAEFRRGNGDTVVRHYAKGERKNTNMTLPRLAFQVFEKQIATLSEKEKENFPVCRHIAGDDLICGIYPSVEAYNTAKHSKGWEYLTYTCKDESMFVIYSWNIFSTVYFVYECMKRFGKPSERFILTYREKKVTDNENPYSRMLLECKNLIFRGAPGTGKTYLARKVAADIVSDGEIEDFSLLSDEQKKQIEFLQFHPGYDYSDFVEGLRPRLNDDGSMGFELQDGIFKRFVAKARKNWEDSQKKPETIEKELSAQEAMESFFSEIEPGVSTFKTINGNEFTITDVTDKRIVLSIPGNAMIKELALNLDELRRMLESDREFKQIKDVTGFFGKTFATQGFSYDFALYKAIKEKKGTIVKAEAKQTALKKFVFIIDEINRGEISKIFGELFFAIDPDYRGQAGNISTQYSNLHADSEVKFYIPENVFIIGTMNDIDRSVDSFDFAMRRRFRFVELKANDRLGMLDELGDKRDDAIQRMKALNARIAKVEELNEDYQVGGSYFAKLKDISSDQLWEDYLQPLLQEYIHGMYRETEIMSSFAEAYGYRKVPQDKPDEAPQN